MFDAYGTRNLQGGLLSSSHPQILLSQKLELQDPMEVAGTLQKSGTDPLEAVGTPLEVALTP